MRRHWKHALLVSGLVLGVALSTYIPGAVASRNSSGTYSLPSGNPVVSGTPISSTWANNTMSDVGSELTLSLDRNGRGAMLAPLQCSAGTVAAPGLTFSGDTDTGLYRIGANNPAITANGVKVQEWSATTATFPLAVAVTGTTALTGAATAAAGVTVAQSTTNGSAVTATGNGTGAGVTTTGGATGAGISATGGATGGNGGTFIGTGSDGDGVRGTGKGTAQGGDFVGGDSSGTGVDGRGGAPNGIGVYAEGAGTGPGLLVHTGHARFTGGNPSSSTAYTNYLTPMNLIKAWGLITGSGGSYSITSGFNLTSVTCTSNTVKVTMASAMANTSYAVLVNDSATTNKSVGGANSTTVVELAQYNSGGSQINLCSATVSFYFLVLGAQ